MKRSVRHWATVGFTWCAMLIGAAAPARAVDRPPSDDQPWPTDERQEARRTPVDVHGRPVTKASAPARRIAPQTAADPRYAAPASSRTPARVPAAAPVARTAPAAPSRQSARPIGSGVANSASPAKSQGRVRPAAAYTPYHERRQVAQQSFTPDDVFEEVPGEIVLDDHVAEEPFVEDPMWVPPTRPEMFHEMECDVCGEGCGHRADCCLIPCPPWGSLQAFFGTHGFTGPVNVGETASFGFHEGVNFGSKLPWGLFPELGWQAGARFTQSNLSGSELTDASRRQTFLTAGVFRRVDHGLQWGVVFDLLQDEWYGQADMTQVRGEFGWVYNCTTEYGVWFTAGGRDATPVAAVPLTPAVRNALDAVWQPTDFYAAYLRKHFGAGEQGHARLYFGGTGDQDGIVGADAMLPMTDNWSFQAGFTYLIPEQSSGAGDAAGHAQESWNLGVSLIWVPGRPADKNYYRPLLSVADNGSFLVDRN